MTDFWTLFNDILEDLGYDISRLKSEGYELFPARSTNLTGYFIKNELLLDDNRVFLARHQSEDGEENIW